MSGSLIECFQRIVAHDAFTGSHVSIDRDATGATTVNIAPDWLDNAALSYLVNLARELELSVAITKDGIRLEEQTSEMVTGVQAVKSVLAAECEEADDDD